jgi:hypothetical protein
MITRLIGGGGGGNKKKKNKKYLFIKFNYGRACKVCYVYTFVFLQLQVIYANLLSFFKALGQLERTNVVDYWSVEKTLSWV